MNTRLLAQATFRSFVIPIISLALIGGSNYARAQAADPQVSGGRPFTYTGGLNIYFHLLGTSTGTIETFETYSPSGLAGGAIFAGGVGGQRLAFNNAANGGATGGPTTFEVRSDLQTNTAQDFNSTLIDGNGATGVSRIFQYNSGAGNNNVLKSRTTISILDGAKNTSNFVNNGGTVYPDTYIGEGASRPAGRLYIFNAYNLIINKANGISGNAVVPNNLIFVQGANMEVAGILTLTSGRVILGSTDTFVITPTGTTGTGSSSAYIDGLMKNLNTTAVNPVFPLGDHSIYAPLTMSNVGTGGTILRYRADTSGTNTGSKAAGIATISRYEHYDINSAAPIGTVISLPYNPAGRTNYVADPTSLILVGYDGSQWKQVAATNSTASGNLVSTTTQSLSGISQLAVGSTDGINPLPVHFISFEAQKDAAATHSLLSWTVADNAYQPVYFDIERSADGSAFKSIGRVEVNGKEGGRFTGVDEQPLTGSNIYRIRAYEASGSSFLTDVRVLRYEDAGSMAISLWPNPAAEKVSINFRGSDSYNAVTVRIMNAAGQNVLMQRAASVKSGSVIGLDVRAVATGTYLLQINDEAGNAVFTTRFNKL